MQESVKAEYIDIRAEIKETQTCITDFVKRFFEIGSVISGVIWYIYSNVITKGIDEAVTSIQKLTIDRVVDISPVVDSIKALSSKTEMLSNVFALLSYIVLAFSGVLFHKFNTHNRYAGYARTLTREIWRLHPSKPAETHLWETVLAPVTPGEWNAMVASLSPKLKEEVGYIEKCQSIGQEFRTKSWLINSLTGLAMMIMSPIRRIETKSWTYPYNIGFALLIPALFLLIAWLYYGISNVGGKNIVFEITHLGCAAYVARCWLGMGHRMFRICDDSGDRTVNYYNKYFQIRRAVCLKDRQIDVEYTDH